MKYQKITRFSSHLGHTNKLLNIQRLIFYAQKPLLHFDKRDFTMIVCWN